MSHFVKFLTSLFVLIVHISHAQSSEGASSFAKLPMPKNEKHLKSIRRLTFGGNNAKAYWNPNGKSFTFQSDFNQWGVDCDQIFHLDLDKALKDTAYRPKMISTSFGRTSCSYFMPNGKDILYASTHLGGRSCPAPPPADSKNTYGLSVPISKFL
jgi:TolB protein